MSVSAQVVLRQRLGNGSMSIEAIFVCVVLCRWLKFEEDVEDGGERWSKPYVATLSLHSLFELRSCILNGTVMLDMRATCIEEIAGTEDVCVFTFACYTIS